MRKVLPLLFLPFVLASCASIPPGAKAISPFDADRYLGKWYEIARFDFTFEKNLDNTTAEYSLNPDGSIRVRNRGHNYVTDKWSEAIGRAKFAGAKDEAMLLVSFFGPFYGGYNVIALDEGYRYALVAGQDLSYLWILSREPTLPDDVRASYLAIAGQLGYKTDGLIWVKHNQK